MKNKISLRSNYTKKGHKSSLGRILFLLTAVFAVSAVITASLFLTAGATEGKEAKEYKKYYSSMRVSADDTLWDLSKEFCSDKESSNEYVKNIKQLNNMSGDTLYEGMNIIYYYYAESK